MSTRLETLRRPIAWISFALVVVLLAVGAVVAHNLTKDRTGVAYFTTAKNIYPKDRVRIVGVDVGEITSIEPEPDKVKVSFTYDRKYALPANVEAAVISPTLVSTRFLQLGPVLTGNGPALPDGGVIPLEHTASPLEFDDLKQQVTDLARSLGPTTQDPTGSLSRFLNVAAANGKGNGARFNQTIKDASAAMQTLADGRQDLFGTISNLQVFVRGLSQVDSQVVEFNDRLSDVSGILSDNSGELQAALASVDRAAGLVDQFVRTNKGPLTTTVGQVGQLTQALAAKRDVIAQALHVGPNVLMNLFNIYNPQAPSLRGNLVVDNLNTPGDLVCTAIANATGNPATAQQQCGQILGPTLNMLRMQPPPIGVNPLTQPGAPITQPGVPEGKPSPPTHPNNPLNGLGGLIGGNR